MKFFGKFSDFWKKSRFFEKKIKIFRFLEDFQISGRFSDFWNIFRVLEDFQIFGRLSTKTILGLVTLEALITILTIENLNS